MYTKIVHVCGLGFTFQAIKIQNVQKYILLKDLFYISSVWKKLNLEVMYFLFKKSALTHGFIKFIKLFFFIK